MLVYVYGKCSTCKAALAFLRKRHIPFIEKDITKETPSMEELQQMLKYQHDHLKKLFNTSGLLYQEMQLKEKLPQLRIEEALALLNQHGMLVKRPFLLADDFGLVGFKEEEWAANF